MPLGLCRFSTLQFLRASLPSRITLFHNYIFHNFFYSLICAIIFRYLSIRFFIYLSAEFPHFSPRFLLPSFPSASLHHKYNGCWSSAPPFLIHGFWDASRSTLAFLHSGPYTKNYSIIHRKFHLNMFWPF